MNTSVSSGVTDALDQNPAYVTRLAYNSRDWWCPAAAEEAKESADSYRSEHGFGHEDWLFRSEWLLDGWRYAFVQGVNRSRKKLLAEGRPFDLRLFTIPSSGNRRAVAEIREVECLTDQLATDAVDAYERLGWLDTMRTEVARAGGRPEALGKTEYAPFILNMRYRLENVNWLDGSVPLSADDPVHRITRYSLCRAHGAMESARPRWRGRKGTTERIPESERKRWTEGGWTTYSPEHVRMQNALLDEVRRRYPGCDAAFESDHIDLTVRTANELLLFEVKSDLSPLSVVRQALGQILEYAYHPRRSHSLPVRLVIVGRRRLEGDDERYFEHLRTNFSLPIEYWSISI